MRGALAGALTLASALSMAACSENPDDPSVPPSEPAAREAGPTSPTEPPLTPVSNKRLARHHILVDKPQGKADISAQEAIRAASDGLISTPMPVAELYAVTVDGLGRPDPSDPSHIENLIQDRLAWVVTFPPKQVSHGGDMFSGPTGGLSQSVVLVDAKTGEFLFADSYPG